MTSETNQFQAVGNVTELLQANELAGRKFSRQDIPDCIWPTDNEFGIPLLRLDLQADALDLPVVQYGTRMRKKEMRGTWAFYVDDYRFSALWKNPAPIMNTRAVNIIEPNFSVFDTTPKALAVYQTYRKRFLARTWQELAGLRVFVDLNVAWEHSELNLAGVPAGWRSYATRGYSDRIHVLEMELDIARLKRGGDDLLFVVYGGGRVVKEYCQQFGMVYVPEQQDKAQCRAIAEDGILFPTGV